MGWLTKHLLYEYSSKIYRFCISTKILYVLFMKVLSYIWKIDACLCNLSLTIIQDGRSSVNSIRVKHFISILVCFEISIFNSCKIGSKILRYVWHNIHLFLFWLNLRLFFFIKFLYWITESCVASSESQKLKESKYVTWLIFHGAKCTISYFGFEKSVVLL